MSKRILDVGNCGPDFSTITGFLTSKFDCTVDQAHGLDDALEKLRGGSYDLVTINRKLDRDYSDGVEILKAIKADNELSSLQVMLVTNLPEHQDLAVSLGALRGFGKLEYELPETQEKLQAVLDA
jgi:two-component system chemotaxis response regulator CheY